MDENNKVEEQQNRNAEIKTHMVGEFLKNEEAETVEEIVDRHEQWLLSEV